MDFKNDPNFLDQHFLTNTNIIKEFISQANLKENDTVVEIGPGKGNVSKMIAKKVEKLYCIELDERLKPFLSNIQKEYNNVEIIYGSALDTFIPKCNKIITSLPYSIVEPFINKLLKCQFEELYMIIGKRYADNVINHNLTKLSLLTNCFFTSEIIMNIEPENFNPKPRVMSSMMRIKPLNKENIKDFNTKFFRYMFYFQDKTVKNAMVESLIRTKEDFNIKLTQRISKNIIKELSIPNILIEKKFISCSN